MLPRNNLLTPQRLQKPKTSFTRWLIKRKQNANYQICLCDNYQTRCNEKCDFKCSQAASLVKCTYNTGCCLFCRLCNMQYRYIIKIKKLKKLFHWITDRKKDKTADSFSISIKLNSSFYLEDIHGDSFIIKKFKRLPRMGDPSGLIF